MSRPFLLAQVSDPHVTAPGTLCRGVNTITMLRTCVAHLMAMPHRPDAVAVTGDLADSGRAGQYAVLRGLLAPLDMPVYLIPGNHDDRDALRDAFADRAYLRQSSGFVQYAIEDHALRDPAPFAKVIARNPQVEAIL